ncbi:hypothetical protein StoSoilB3_42200 (plasmid) [Arthrobacter sp. StoSoilB3]|nr:hypothetical protein StoSoilB3_42200 [Arthrobacter sp. StoSoilB3]
MLHECHAIVVADETKIFNAGRKDRGHRFLCVPSGFARDDPIHAELPMRRPGKRPDQFHKILTRFDVSQVTHIWNKAEMLETTAQLTFTRKVRGINPLRNCCHARWVDIENLSYIDGA